MLTGYMSVDYKSSPWSHFVLTLVLETFPLACEKGGIPFLRPLPGEAREDGHFRGRRVGQNNSA